MPLARVETKAKLRQDSTQMPAVSERGSAPKQAARGSPTKMEAKAKVEAGLDANARDLGAR